MDEELGGVNPNSFFEQITEVRGVAETAQKTSNSNLSLLNELKEKVEVISNDLRLIKDKQFADEDRRQKEEMQAKVKEQNEKTKGAVVENKGESQGTKGGGGGIIGFVTSFIGGLVGGVTGLAIQGVGGLIGLGTGLIKKGADFGKSVFKKIFGDKKKKKKGKGEVKPVVTPNNVMNLKLDDEDEDKNKRGDGAKNRGIGGLIGSVFGGNFSGDQQKNERGQYAFKNKDESSTDKNKDESSTEVKPEESFSTSIKYSVKGGEVDPNSLEPGVPLERAQQHFYKSKISELQFEIRNEKLEFGDDANTSSMEEELKKFQKKYNDTLEFGGIETKIDPPNKDKKKKNIFGFNFGGLVQGYNQGGEVDSVPAMLTPGEFVVTKDAVEKVGADTLKGLNASVGATNKASNLGSFEIKRLDAGDLSKDALVKKSSFMNNVEDIEISNESGTDYFREITDLSTGGLDSTTITRNVDTFTNEDGTIETLVSESRMREQVTSIGLPDLIEHKDQLMGEINKLKGFENVTFDQFLNHTHGIPQDKLLPILMRSDAQKATSLKEEEARKLDFEERGIKIGSGKGFNMSANDSVGRTLQGTMGYRIGQTLPTQYVSAKTEMTDEKKLNYSVGKPKKSKPDPLLSDLSASINASVKGYNEGGLVGSSIAPIIESKNENGEMKLIKNLSQSVDSNRQTLIVKEEQNQVMNPPNQNPNPVALADTPQTSPAPLQETEAPIPFASLLRQSAQRYLNLGNNAMVIS